MSKGKFALGALFGAAVGVVAGILTAPKSGKETREDIKRKANDAADKASKAVEEAKVKGGKLYKDARSNADAAVKDARGTAENYADRVRRAAASAKAELDREDSKK